MDYNNIELSDECGFATINTINNNNIYIIYNIINTTIKQFIDEIAAPARNSLEIVLLCSVLFILFVFF